MRRLFVTTCLLTAVLAMPAGATTISVDPGTGDPNPASAPGFTWQGLNFTLQGQPGNQISANHRVAGQANGDLNIFLEEGVSAATGGSNAKVTYGAKLPQNTRLGGGFRYGTDLTQSTPQFSNMQIFFRRLDAAAGSIATQILVGSDAANPDSPFAGINARAGGQGGNVSGRDFLINTPFGAEGRFDINSQGNGTTNTQVNMNGVNDTATNTEDLTPTGTPDPFYFDEVLLQVETFQPDDLGMDPATDFQEQFGSTGQKFVFTGLTVPAPATLGLFGIGLMGLAAATRRRAAR